MKKFCKSLKEHAVAEINFKKKKMKLLTKEQYKSIENVNIWYIFKGIFEDKYTEDKKYHKIRYYYTGE